MAGIKGKSGPQKGSLATLNKLRNGSSMKHKRLTVGELPKELLSARREGRAYRRELEAQTVAVKGEVGITDAHHIDTASAATIHAAICRWLLRHRIDRMSTNDILACSREMTKAKQTRDAAVRALDLDKEPEPIRLQDYLNQQDNSNADNH